MPTVTQLADRVCQVTGLATTGTERALVVAALNNAYQRAIDESDAYQSSTIYNMTNGVNEYDISGDGLRIMNVTYTGGGISDRRLTPVSPSKIMEWSTGASASNGPPSYYATFGTSTLFVWPTPGTGETLTLRYVAAPPTLVESAPGAGQESTPSKIPDRFHWDVLMCGAVVEALDKDQRGQDVSFWLQRYEAGIAKLVEFVNRFNGGPTSVFPDSVVRGPQDAYPREDG